METMEKKMIKFPSLAFIYLISICLYGQKIDKAIEFTIGSENFQKMEFAYSNTKAGKDYVKYLFIISENECLIFDIGVESDREVTSIKPLDAVLMNASVWVKLDDSIREKIISGNQELKLVLPAGVNQFRIAPVYAIEWILIQNNRCEFRSPDMEFVLDMNRDIVLASSDLKLQKITEINNSLCKSYTIRKNSKLNTDLFKDITWTPKLGVIKESFSENQGEYSLLRIKGIPFIDYMSSICIESQVNNQNDNSKNLLRSKGNQSTSSEERMHLVEKGETFFGIAKKYNVLPGELMDYNPGVDPNRLKIGLAIKIPAEKIKPKSSDGTHVFKEADNIEKIALTFGITHQDIYRWNPDFDEKVVGDIIFIKAPENDPIIEGMRTKGAEIPENNKANLSLNSRMWENTDGKHIVRANETVPVLAEAYGFTEARFRQMNGLTPNEKINPGQTLITVICPVSNIQAPQNRGNSEEIKTLKESPSESLSTESKPEENVPYFDIQNGKMKSLFSEPEIISEERGDQKTIKGSSSQREIYVVQQGDTMSSISRKFNIPEIKLRELNKLTAGEIVIPRQRIFLN